ncbi:hypothetical protein EJ05DRAFT_477689 [Pseudovirgaria hyperparasitica]|uniref:Uncharacterized protein n=1 Tax=Pseudovirgaria hyperparasitica TaxID=470096 RepID=A0A6A6W3Q8_9PEZI|nr:uncharacterized protein EJ05DRAFT_477689 [Pseudovirgaria hyperparasitica]KAF2756570.1 hypothetical protein EJ05DRAFT_477689 [Pseudovirgaria hyperparasitica]
MTSHKGAVRASIPSRGSYLGGGQSDRLPRGRQLSRRRSFAFGLVGKMGYGRSNRTLNGLDGKKEWRVFRKTSILRLSYWAHLIFSEGLIWYTTDPPMHTAS